MSSSYALSSSYSENANNAIYATSASSAFKLVTNQSLVTSSINPPATPYRIDEATPAIIYLNPAGSNIGLNFIQGIEGQIVTFTPYTTENNISSSLISISASQANVYGLNNNIIPFPIGNDTLDNILPAGGFTNLFSFSFQYTTLDSNPGWYLINISKD